MTEKRKAKGRPIAVTEKDRGMWWRLYLHGLTPKAIAVKYEVSEGAVRRDLFGRPARDGYNRGQLCGMRIGIYE